MIQHHEDTTAVRAPKRLGDKQATNACLIVLSGHAVGRIFKLTDGQYIIGRTEAVEISLEDEGVSRRHASVSVCETTVTLKDLESTNGTFVNGESIRIRTLVNGDRIQVGANTILKFAVQDEIDEQFQYHLFSAATRDALTQTYNRRHFDDQLSRDMSYARRHSSPLSLAMIDLDHFKRINDAFGHAAGDSVLREFASTVQATIRNEDFLCRVGGEEFALVMRGTDVAGAITVCERLRRIVEQTRFAFQDASIPVTLSIGIAQFEATRHAALEDLVRDADEQLYAAKAAGRNRIYPTAS